MEINLTVSYAEGIERVSRACSYFYDTRLEARNGFHPEGCYVYRWKSKTPSGSVRMSGSQVELNHSSTIPLIRTESVPAHVSIYKHRTPTGVKAQSICEP